MQNTNQNIGIIGRVAKAALKPFGLQVSRQQQQAEMQRSLIARLFKMIGLSLYSWGHWDNHKFITEGFMGNADLYSIVNRITSTAAVAPFKVFRVKDQKKFRYYKAWTGSNATKGSLQRAMLIKNQVFEEDSSHPMNALLERPNHWQGCNEFTQTSIGFKLLTGNRFWFVNKLEAGANAGKPHGIFNMPPQHMTIVIGDTLWTINRYELNLGRVQPIPKESIIHSRYWNPNYDMTGSHLWGLSPLRAASKTLDRSNKAEERGVTMLDNAGAAGVLFEKTASLTTEQAEKMKRKLNEEVLGLDNSGRIALANGDMGYLNFGLTAVEMEILKQEEFSMQRLANIYKAPAGLFLANANATDNNIAAWNKQLLTQAVIPALNELRDDWNKVAERYQDAIYVDYDISVFPELQEDLEKVANIMAKSWWFTPNQKRLAMGTDEDTTEPMMNKYLVPANLQEISNLNPDMLEDELDREPVEDDL